MVTWGMSPALGLGPGPMKLATRGVWGGRGEGGRVGCRWGSARYIQNGAVFVLLFSCLETSSCLIRSPCEGAADCPLLFSTVGHVWVEL